MLCLFIKKENASCMKDLRPIALYNILYKILVKAFANKLKVVLPEIIIDNQSTFVKDKAYPILFLLLLK